MKKAIIVLMILTFLSKIVGFLRDVTLAYFYGASGISDAYLIALTIPVVIFGVVARGIATGYIPMYSRIEENNGPAHALRFTNNLINVLLVFSTLIVGLGMIFAEQLVMLFASGFEGEIFDTAVYFTRVTLAGIYFTIFIRVLSAYLNYQKLFAVPNLLGIPMSLIVIASIVVSSEMGEPAILPYGFVAALFVQWVILMFFSYRKDFKYKKVFDVKDEHLRRMLILAVPVILGSAVHQINKLVDRTLASQVAIGGISALNYAHTLTNFVHGVFVMSISTVMFPSLSRMASKGNTASMKYALHQSVVGVALLTIPATAGALVFAEPVVRLLFGRGAFDSTALVMTAGAFFFYSIGMLGAGLRVVLSQAFYSLQDTRTPMINAAIAMGLNIVLNFLLAPVMGINGLALATSISGIFCAILLFFNLRKRIGSLQFRKMGLAFGKIVAASAVMALAAYYLYNYLLGVLAFAAALLLTIFLAAVIYFVLLYFMKVEALDNGMAAIKRRLVKRS
ncbi:murein biosynthesis integral membrane protein MurJ [Evansella clarkii]|uniref:murein biosynthesis integral membrane protein MurJ n=1 Tax=Evansella clarkii TaxID=79879 RepID=UPI000996CA27|nr:murein biosynthesis integral membrane protein MurJ [Evansella clarkii]